MLCPHCGQETGFSSAITWNAPVDTTLSWNPALAATAAISWPYWNTNSAATLTFTAPIGVPPHAPTLHTQDPQTDAGDAQESACTDPGVTGTTVEADTQAQSSAADSEEADECSCDNCYWLEEKALTDNGPEDE